MPLYRLNINPDEKGTQPSIRMAGQAIGQRSTLTVNHGRYFMDTTVSESKQKNFPDDLASVFKKGETYHVFLLFAKPAPDDLQKGPPATRQTYQVYIGSKSFTVPNNVFEVRADTTNAPIIFHDLSVWDWDTPNYENGILTVTIDTSFQKFKDDHNKVAHEHCQPQPRFCSWNGNSCGCALSSADKLFNQCQAVCSGWTNKDVDCPDGGCYGFGIKFPDDFVANNQATIPTPECYLDNSDWNVPFVPASDKKAGTCFYKSVPQGTFCKSGTGDVNY